MHAAGAVIRTALTSVITKTCCHRGGGGGREVRGAGAWPLGKVVVGERALRAEVPPRSQASRGTNELLFPSFEFFFHLFFSSSSSSSSSRLPNCTLIVMQSRRLDPALIRNQLHEFPKQFGLQFTKRRERKRKTPQKRLWRHANETNPLQ